MAKRNVVLCEYDEESKQISITLNCNHIPTLALLVAKIQYELTELLAKEKTALEIKNSSTVIVPGKRGGIINFVRGGKN